MADNLNGLWPGWDTLGEITPGSRIYTIRRQTENTEEYAAVKVISIPGSDGEVQKLRAGGISAARLSEDFSRRRNDVRQQYAALARIADCPNLVSCRAFRSVQQDNGLGWDLCIQMEPLDPLTAALQEGFSDRLVIQLGLDICNALIRCGKSGIVHRDIRPENIFVSDGVFKLGNFGADRPENWDFIAPEIYHNRPCSSSADIYSLGLVMYWLLNGQSLPFTGQGDDSDAVLRRLEGQPLTAPAHGCEALQNIILKACAFHPSRRYASPAQMRNALEKLYRKLVPGDAGYAPPRKSRPAAPPTTPGTALLKTVTPPQAKRPALVPLVWLLAILTLIALGTALWMASGWQIPSFLCRHVWQDATCTAPRTCSRCGKAEGAPLPHRWAAATCITPEICQDCSISSGTALGHDWVPASCTAAETCARCSQTNGIPLPHRWIGATCTTPVTCSQCGEALGEATGHDWIPATKIAPRTCRTCGIQEGTPLVFDNRKYTSILAAGTDHTAALKSDGTVVAAGKQYSGEHLVEEWSDITAIFAAEHITIGLQSNGTLVIAGNSNSRQKFQDLDSWEGLSTIALGADFAIGLKQDCTVILSASPSTPIDVSGWTDIEDIAAGSSHAVGLKADGTAVAAGKNDSGQCEVAGWNSIIAIAAGADFTIGLKSDGTVVSASSSENFRDQLAGWTDIIAVCAYGDHALGLKKDGTIMAAGEAKSGQTKVSHWTDIIALNTGATHTVGLKSDGSVVITSGRYDYDGHAISQWSDIRIP